MHRRVHGTFAVMLLTLAAHGACAALPLAGAKASPQLSPREVVRLQLQALQHNDDPAPDSGIATAFALATPQNQAQIGPLRRFIRMVHENYSEMLNHRESRLPAGKIRGDEAWQPVELTDQDGRKLRYLFILRRQETPPCSGCWMTDGVLPAESARKPPQIAL